jgi:hypothetical protein
MTLIKRGSSTGSAEVSRFTVRRSQFAVHNSEKEPVGVVPAASNVEPRTVNGER